MPTETRTVGGDIHTAPVSTAADGSAEESTPTMPIKAGPVVTTLMEQGEVISTQSITSKTRTVETVTVSSFHIFTFFKFLKFLHRRNEQYHWPSEFISSELISLKFISLKFISLKFISSESISSEFISLNFF